MPGSARENDNFVLDFVQKNNIKTVLDIGCGKGTYYDLLSGEVTAIDGVEVWQPYIEEFNLRSKYRFLIEKDVRELKPLDVSGYDMVVFGDVLEHMSLEDARNVWEWASWVAQYGLISVPIIHYPQGAEFGNPYEVHVQDHLHPEDIRREFGPFETEALYEITGTFIKRF